MTPERWRLVESIFDAYLEAEASDRDGLLARRCGGDTDLRHEVEALLAHAEATGRAEPDGRLEEIVGRSRQAVFDADAARPVGTRRPGERVGAYRLVQCLGEGGMGSVWRAVRADDEFEQEVAIKFVGAIGRERGWTERFRVERQILAQLEHPHIARLLGGGSTDDGQPFLVMELVDGEELLAYCDTRRLGLRERLRLFLQVAGAVDHAHRHLVVHRDLKPANILVHPDAGPKLLDFGIAKLLPPPADGDLQGADDEGAGSPVLDPTLPQDRLLTPDYASPEQILGRPVTVASDVYSLGVLLCELLTGRRPRRLRELTPAQRERQLIDTTATAPSALVRRTDAEADALAAQRGLDARRLARSLRGDLDTIVLRALDTEPARRYPSASDLAADVERHLRGEPVHARPDAWSYRAGKWLRRHPWGAAATVAIALMLAALVVGLLVHMRQVEAERDRAVAAEAEAQTVSSFLMHLFEVADPGQSRGETITARELLERGAAQIGPSLDRSPTVQASLLSTLADIHLNLGLLQRGEELHRQALERRIEHRGGDSLEAAASHDRLGEALRQLTRMDEAEEHLRRSLEIRSAHLPPNHPALADSLNNLGLLLMERGRLDDAEPLIRRGLEIRVAALGAEHPETVVSRANLGQLLMETGRLDEASAALESVVSSRLARFGPSHPKVGASLHALGTLRTRQGRLEEAEDLLLRALDIKRRVLPADHPHITATLNNLASLLHDQARLREAEPLYREAIEIERAAGAAEALFHAFSLNNLGSLLEEMGRYDEAEPLYRRSLEIRRRRLGEGASTAKMRSKLGRLAVHSGRLDDAEALLAETTSWYDEHTAPGDGDRLRNLERVALLRRARGDADASASLLHQALDEAALSYAPDHGIHVELAAELAASLAASAEPARCLAAVDRGRSAPAARADDDLLRGRLELATGLCLRAVGRDDEARASLRAAVAHLAPGLGEGNHWVREACVALDD